MTDEPKVPRTTFARLIAKRKNEPSGGDGNGDRPSGRPVGQRENEDQYVIDRPARREKYRQAFDVFKDQKLALEKLQLVLAASTGNKPAIGYMVQQAIDLYIKKQVRELPNVRLKKQGAA